jgi:cytochrome d ubiquinol oxidase subunit II
MVNLWWCLFGLLTCGYFALAGYDYGIGMLLRGFRGDERRVLGAFGPFFLANEVWLVAAVGVLFGAFPHLEGKLFAGAYVLVVTLLLGLVTFTASVQLRARRPDSAGAGWTFGIVAGAAVTAVSWGLFLGNLVLGLPLDTAGRSSGDLLALFNPYALLWGVGVVALFCLQGAVFLAVRGPAELAGRAARLARALTAPVLTFAVVALLWGLFAVHGATWLGAGAIALAFAALALVSAGLRAKRHRVALVGSMLLSASPALLVGTLRFPAVLVSGSGYELSVGDAGTAPETYALLTWFAPPAIVILLAVQWLTWRANRHPLDHRSLLHF